MALNTGQEWRIGSFLLAWAIVWAHTIVQMRDNKVDFVAIISVMKGERLIVEIELASTEKRGVLRRVSSELRWGLDLEIFEYRSGDNWHRGPGVEWTRGMRI